MKDASRVLVVGMNDAEKTFVPERIDRSLGRWRGFQLGYTGQPGGKPAVASGADASAQAQLPVNRLRQRRS